MDAKLLTAQGWTNAHPHNASSDHGLQVALSAYEKVPESDHAERLKRIAVVGSLASSLAASLKASKDKPADPKVAKYLADLSAAVEAKRHELADAKAKVEKSAILAHKAEMVSDKLAAEEAKKLAASKHAEEVRQQIGKPLMAGIKQVTGNAGKASQWISTLKDPKSRTPVPALLIAPIIGSGQQKLLTQVTGCTQFLKGTCLMEKGKLTFVVPGASAPSTLVSQIRESIQYFTKTSVQVSARGAGQTTSVEDASAKLAGGTALGSKLAPGVSASADRVEPLANAVRPFEITESVGRGGKNRPEDVVAVQAALNRRNAAGLGEPDGKCGPKTIKAIEDFQKALGQSKPDGLVEPGRGTARELAASGKIGPAPTPLKTISPPKLGKPELASAPQVWHGTREIVDNNIKALKRAIKQEYAGEHPKILAAIDENVVKLDAILDKLDRRLADSLAKARAATDETARKAELTNSKAILAEYIAYVKSEPLIDQIDSNPFGVDTHLEKVLTDSLTHMAMSITA